MLGLIVLAVAFMGLSALDLRLTILVLRFGGQEMNRLMRPLFGKSTQTIWSVNMALAAAITSLFLLSAGFEPTLATILFTILAAARAFVCLHNGIELRRQKRYAKLS